MPLPCTFFGAITIASSPAKKIHPATLSFLGLLERCIHASVPPTDRIIPTKRVMRNNPTFSVINLFRESLRNLNAKLEPSRKPHDKPVATQTIPSTVMSFGRRLDTGSVYTLHRAGVVRYEESSFNVCRRKVPDERGNRKRTSWQISCLSAKAKLGTRKFRKIGSFASAGREGHGGGRRRKCTSAFWPCSRGLRARGFAPSFAAVKRPEILPREAVR
jgi:hypothetical protein